MAYKLLKHVRDKKMNGLHRNSLALLRGQEGGVSIAFVFLMILIFSTLGFVSYSIMAVDTRMTVHYTKGQQVQYLAEAGAEYGIKLIFNGQLPPYSETVSTSGGTFNIQVTDQDSVIQLLSGGYVGDAGKQIEILLRYNPPIGDFALFATGEVTNVESLDEAGDPAPELLVENAPSLPDIDDDALIALATSQGHVYASNFEPANGYPNYNFYYTGTTPNVTYVQGDLKVKGGRSVYGIFVVEGDIYLEGSSRVYGVLYMTDPNNIVIHGGGNPTQSSVTGGIVANGDVDGTGNHITVHYSSEYMKKFEEYEIGSNVKEILTWREL